MENFKAGMPESSKCLSLRLVYSPYMISRAAYSKILEGISRDVGLAREDVRKLTDYVAGTPFTGLTKNPAALSNPPLKLSEDQIKRLQFYGAGHLETTTFKQVGAIKNQGTYFQPRDILI